jgi:hypothetical protein
MPDFQHMPQHIKSSSRSDAYDRICVIGGFKGQPLAALLGSAPVTSFDDEARYVIQIEASPPERLHRPSALRCNIRRR